MLEDLDLATRMDIYRLECKIAALRDDRLKDNLLEIKELECRVAFLMGVSKGISPQGSS